MYFTEMNNNLSLRVDVVCEPESDIERLYISTELPYIFRVNDNMQNRKSCFHGGTERLQEHLRKWKINNWEFELMFYTV
jgi:hypothetical protein